MSLTKLESGYSVAGVDIPRSLFPPRGKGIRCGTCKFFRGVDVSNAPGGCFIVQGIITAQGCCSYWAVPGRESNPGTCKVKRSAPGKRPQRPYLRRRK